MKAPKYHPPITPVLELYVQIHQEPGSGHLAIEVRRTLGLTDSVSCYSDRCTSPMDRRIIGEMEDAFLAILELEIESRWGIQERVVGL